MDKDIINNLLSKVEGCTFATLDSITFPKKGVRCETEGTRVILFTNKRSSGYENMVKRRLEASGKNPANFVLGDLPWGTRLPNSPLIEHDGGLYLQTIVLADGDSRYYVGDRLIGNPSVFGIKLRRTSQGLPPSEEVIVSTYKLSSITRITLMGDTVSTAERRTRSILHIKHG